MRKSQNYWRRGISKEEGWDLSCTFHLQNFPLVTSVRRREPKHIVKYEFCQENMKGDVEKTKHTSQVSKLD